MAYMQKRAKFGWGDAVALLNPLDTMIGAKRDTPMQLAKNPIANRAIWNALFSGGLLLATGAGLKYLSGREQNKHLDKKQQEAIDAKLNGIVPVTEPDADLKDTEQREKRRKKEMSVDKKADDDGAVTNALWAALPIAAAGGAVYAGSKLIGDKQKTNREESLKKEIAELQNKLDSLYSQRLALSEQRRALKKQADDERGPIQKVFDWIYGSPNPHDGETSVFSRLTRLPITTAAVASLLAGYGAYKYFSKRDEDRAKVKMLEKRILPADLVGTPPTIIMETDKDGKLRVPGRGGKVVEIENKETPVAAVVPASDNTLQALGLNL